MQSESTPPQKPMNSVPIFSIMEYLAFVGKPFSPVDGSYRALGLLENGGSK